MSLGLDGRRRRRLEERRDMCEELGCRREQGLF